MADFPPSCNPVISPSEFLKSMSDETKNTPKKDYRDVRVRLTIQQIDKLETLREKWGLKSKTSALARLIETISEED